MKRAIQEKRGWNFLPAVIATLCLLHATGKSQTAEAPQMKITSGNFTEGGDIPSRFTCDGENTSPQLQIEGVPQAAKSLVLIVDDPDAPNGTFTHWLMWNLKPDLKEIPANAPPKGALQGRNDFGRRKYSGPCPPSGTHRYYFRLYALDYVPSLPAGAPRKAVDKAIQEHLLERAAILMGRYERKGK